MLSNAQFQFSQNLKKILCENEPQPEINNDSKSPVPFLKRDGFGKKGRVITVKANSFEVTKISKYDEFLKYNIEIKPMDAGKNANVEVKRERSDYEKCIRRRVLKELGLIKEDWFQGVVIAYDGGTTLYTTSRLGFNRVNDDATEEIICLDDIQNLDGEPTQYKVKINRTDTIIKLTQLEKYISGEEFEWDFFNDDALDVFNALIHQVAAENYTQSGKSSIYNKGKKSKIPGGLELWSGWFSTVRPGQGSLFVNVNPTYTTFYQPLRLDEFLIQYLNLKNRSIRNELNDLQKLKKINKILKELLVRPLHMKPVQTERRIKKLLSAAEVTNFKYKPKVGTDWFSLEKYFKDNYQYHNKLFVEIIGYDDTNMAWPIEFCQIIEGQRFSNKELSKNQRKEIILASRIKPFVNENETIKGAREILQLQNDPTDVGMEVASELARVDARVLESTNVKYAGNIAKPSNGQWNLKGVKFFESGEALNSWHVIIFEQAKWISMEVATNFIRNLIKQCRIQGMNISKTPHIEYVKYKLGHLDNDVREAYQNAKDKLNKPPQMILFIIPGDNAPNNINTELYEIIKRIMDTEIGCLSQCIKMDPKKNFNSPQYCSSLAMKINLKLGGINSILPEDKLRLSSGENVLFLGADVTHPKDKNGLSICAVVGSLDNQAARFITKYQAQKRSGKEEIVNIDEMIKKLLKEYCDYQKKSSGVKKDVASFLPPCIIMYRDGVSESQFEQVLKLELPKIKAACAEFRAGYEPKITFAVVGKRHRTRLFPENKNEADKNGNCFVGTIVDRKITHPTLNDFYLQSHYANQGTARPSHYTILYDDIKLTIDEFQGLSNTLCYNFQRTTSSVSIPAPTYYAHLTCARAKMYLNGTKKLPDVHENLKNYPMYFI
ncbi:Piwi domain-containing protein [Glomus cerebriforme]|uniref:Piwi domain-containing protein n=1 Tax=Glomus cerebriforme TaxID=658196 RepID=A0A397T5D5_9GLOM|nr:Piwi domain-containing protein [Glomus cerebriforme]